MPNIDSRPELLFDWRYPQFLASEGALESRRREHQLETAGVYSLGEELSYDSSSALFRSWYPPEAGWRWSRGTSPEFEMACAGLMSDVALVAPSPVRTSDSQGWT